MANVNLNLSYDKLSVLLQEETNKQDIQVRGHKIQINQLVMTAENSRLRITGKINSTWDAFFDFSAIPAFNSEENKLLLDDIKLKLDANNLIFKGILKLAKGNIKTRIEKQIEQPINDQLKVVQSKLDLELAKAPLPNNLQLQSSTKAIQIQEIQARAEYLFVSAIIDQDLNISFKNEAKPDVS
jgi:hypothetical protein